MKKPRLKGSFIRTCAACGKQGEKYKFLRIAKDKNGVFIDASGKGEGRGVYICKDKACLEKVKKTGRLSRLLKADFSHSVYDEMENFIGKE
ncbi:MAG: DUF448 domain-containing protein [Clostridiales bacterium]|nr:MAG: DUF448 domain-containing protein [Clostridiales bacterium]